MASIYIDSEALMRTKLNLAIYWLEFSPCRFSLPDH